MVGISRVFEDSFTPIVQSTYGLEYHNMIEIQKQSWSRHKYSEAQLGPSQTSKMKSFTKIVIFAKSFILDICLGSDYVSECRPETEFNERNVTISKKFSSDVTAIK